MQDDVLLYGARDGRLDLCRTHRAGLQPLTEPLWLPSGGSHLMVGRFTEGRAAQVLLYLRESGDIGLWDLHWHSEQRAELRERLYLPGWRPGLDLLVAGHFLHPEAYGRLELFGYERATCCHGLYQIKSDRVVRRERRNPQPHRWTHALAGHFGGGGEVHDLLLYDAERGRCVLRTVQHGRLGNLRRPVLLAAGASTLLAGDFGGSLRRDTMDLLLLRHGPGGPPMQRYTLQGGKQRGLWRRSAPMHVPAPLPPQVCSGHLGGHWAPPLGGHAVGDLLTFDPAASLLRAWAVDGTQLLPLWQAATPSVALRGEPWLMAVGRCGGALPFLAQQMPQAFLGLSPASIDREGRPVLRLVGSGFAAHEAVRLRLAVQFGDAAPSTEYQRLSADGRGRLDVEVRPLRSTVPVPGRGMNLCVTACGLHSERLTNPACASL